MNIFFLSTLDLRDLTGGTFPSTCNARQKCKIIDFGTLLYNIYTLELYVSLVVLNVIVEIYHCIAREL